MRCFLYQHVDEEWHELIARSKTCLYYEPGEVVLHEGSSVTGVYFVQSGGLKVYQTSKYRTQTLRYLRSGEFLEHGVFKFADQFKYSAQTVKMSKVCFVEASVFQHIFKNNPAFATQLLKNYSEQLHRTERRLRNMSVMTVRERIADVLIYLAERFGEHIGSKVLIDVELNRAELAELAGTYPEQISRVLGGFEKESLILKKHKTITITDIQKLKKLIEYYR